jgi:hypothetical protein
MGKKHRNTMIFGQKHGKRTHKLCGTTWETTMNVEEKHRKKNTWTTYN